MFHGDGDRISTPVVVASGSDETVSGTEAEGNRWASHHFMPSPKVTIFMIRNCILLPIP
jgi:hypothetical protein